MIISTFIFLKILKICGRIHELKNMNKIKVANSVLSQEFSVIILMEHFD